MPGRRVVDLRFLGRLFYRRGIAALPLVLERVVAIKVHFWVSWAASVGLRELLYAGRWWIEGEI